MTTKQGRPQKDMTAQTVAKRARAGKRLRDIRVASVWNTQKSFAGQIGVSEATLRRYEHGDTDIPPWVAEKIYRLTEVQPEYLFCDPGITSYDDYLAVNPMLEQLKHAYSTHWEQIDQLFAFLGYRVEIDTRATDIARSKAAERPSSIVVRKVTSLVNPGFYFYCDESEIGSIIMELKNCVGFIGYKKNQSQAE